MKTEKFARKLNLKKEVVFDFSNKSKIKGGMPMNEDPTEGIAYTCINCGDPDQYTDQGCV